MKSNLVKFAFLPLVAFTLIFTLSNCKKDKKPTLRETLVGEWEIKSFTIDGVETKGSVVKASKMEFEKYTGNNGDFEWTISYMDGSTDIEAGDYEVDEEDGEIEFQSADGNTIKLEFDINGDELELEGIIDAERVVIKADRD